MDAAWGSGFFEQLSKELMLEFPNMKGFSTANLRFTKRFYLFYSQGAPIRYQVGSELAATNFHQAGGELQAADSKENVIRQQVAEEFEGNPIFQIPWFHHVQIITKCKSVRQCVWKRKCNRI
jgi:hypothetical protein